MDEVEKAEYYRQEMFGAPTIEHLNFRCQKRLAAFLKTKAMEEQRDVSSIIRRLLNIAARAEGYDPNGY